MAATPERKTVVLFGIEAHVCVQQTALDLLEGGYEVHVLVDGVSSQRALDRAVALKVRPHPSFLPCLCLCLGFFFCMLPRSLITSTFYFPPNPTHPHIYTPQTNRSAWSRRGRS